MKTILLGTFITLLLIPSFAHAIVFYQNKGGSITKIDEAAFKSCDKIIFREAGKDELPGEFKRKVLNALLKGDAVNDAKAASDALKSNASACSYSDKDDLK